MALCCLISSTSVRREASVAKAVGVMKAYAAFLFLCGVAGFAMAGFQAKVPLPRETQCHTEHPQREELASSWAQRQLQLSS